MSRKYFGTDGVRGRVGEAPITADFMLRLGHAAGEVFKRHDTGGKPTVLIGKDTRVSGYMIEAALEAGFTSAGVNVQLTGPLPTAAVAYLTRALRLSAGVVISASHNPYYDNGIKFFSAEGAKLPDSVELEIEALLERPLTSAPSETIGRAKRIDDAAGRYIEFCKSTFPNELNLRGMRVVVDCANGAAYEIAPHVFHELGAEVIAIGASPDGFNINEKIGATHPGALKAAVKAHRADLGIALDGDADRLLMIDADGRLYNGDELLYVVVADGIDQGKQSGAVGTLMTNLAVENALKQLHVPFARARVGDRYVLEMMVERGWLWGGESSGHLLCLDKHTTGDGIVSALQVLSAIRRSGRTLAELTAEVTLYPQTMINVKIGKGFDWERFAPLARARESVAADLGDSGRILIRPSGTEPVLRVMVEAQSEDVAATAVKRLVASLEGVV
jgi:phosphoglucosamine mutase